ncbi:MAG: TolB family protein [Lentisphaerae bacterium]|nr:TolB family protein [Lentisphaerota bacterium]
MKFILLVLFLLGCSLSFGDELVFGTDARDSLGKMVRIPVTMKEDGSGRRNLLSPDFVGENFWPGYRGAGGPSLYDTADVSPLGRRVLFTNTFSLYSLEWNGGPVFAISRFTREKYQPRWSPDGKKIAFASDLNENCEIYVMNGDGTELKKITWNKSQNLSPTWSPDGKKIAFISDRNKKFELFATDLKSFQTKQLLALDRDIREPDWGKNGKILFSTQLENGTYALMSLNTETGKTETIFTSPAWCGHPAWNSDCTKIAYSSVQGSSADIMIYDLTARKHRNLTDSPVENEYFPRWVPVQLSEQAPALQKDMDALASAGLDEEERRGNAPLRPYPLKIPNVPLPRPRMLFTAEDLPGICARLASEPYSTAWKRFLARCDKAMHDPNTMQSIQSIPQDVLRERYAITVFAELYYRAPWLEAMQNCAFAYQVTRKQEYGDYAARVLLQAAKVSHDAYGVMHCDERTACTFDWVYDRIPQEERQALCRLLNRSLESKKQTCLNNVVGIYGRNPGSGNYAIYFAASLGPMALALSGEPSISDDALDIASHLAELTLNTWISPKGDAEEGFSYFNHPCEKILPFLISLQKNRLAPWLEVSNLKNTLTWIAESAANNNTETPAIGDCDYLTLRFPVGLLELYPDTPWGEKLWNNVPRSEKELNTITGLLWWRPSTNEKQDFSQLPRTVLFPKMEFAVLRAAPQEDFLLTVSAPSGAGHAHLEYGAVTLNAFGKRFLADPGQAVSMPDCHSQILVNGAGRVRNTVPVPMLKGISSDKLTDTVDVDFTDAFRMGFFGAPGTSGIPCGRAGIESGKRQVIQVRGAGDIPTYYIIHDSVLTGQPAVSGQLFVTDQGMRLTQEENGALRIEEAVGEEYGYSPSGKAQASWRIQVPADGLYYLHIYAKTVANVWLSVDGQKEKPFRFAQPPSRPNTWQWRPILQNKELLCLTLTRGEHTIAVKTSSQFCTLALSTEKLLLGEMPETDKGILLKFEKAEKTGDWKTLRPSKDALLVIPMETPEKTEMDILRFTTRFHGQLPVAMPRFSFNKSGKETSFISLLFPLKDGSQPPKIQGRIISFPQAEDTVQITEGKVSVTRKIQAP